MKDVVDPLCQLQCVKSHHLGGAKAGHTDASMVMAVEVEAVKGGEQPEIDAGDPHEHCVLETLGQVRVGCVPRTVPVLQQRRKQEERLRESPEKTNMWVKLLKMMRA